MENEALIGNSLVFLGIFIILMGFFIFVLGNFFEIRSSGSRSRQPENEDFFERKGVPERSGPFERSGSARQGFGKKSTCGYGTERNFPENSSSLKVRGGGVIMLGPVPIVFGSDGDSAKSAIILAIILTILAFLIFRGPVFQ